MIARVSGAVRSIITTSASKQSSIERPVLIRRLRADSVDVRWSELAVDPFAFEHLEGPQDVLRVHELRSGDADDVGEIGVERSSKLVRRRAQNEITVDDGDEVAIGSMCFEERVPRRLARDHTCSFGRDPAKGEAE